MGLAPGSALLRVDFSGSRMRWVTKSLKSDGSFRIEAVLSMVGRDRRQQETFALGAGVIAGNMFVSDGLVKKPLYHFQVAASQSRHVIYRTYVEDLKEAPCAADTAAANDEIFESLETVLASAPARALESYMDIEAAYDRGEACNGVLELEAADGYGLLLEFPVKHLNLQRERRMFQVETGPVLFADPAIGGARLSRSPRALVPCFVHFNRFDRADITFDFPFGRGRARTQGGDACISLNCSARLLAPAE